MTALMVNLDRDLVQVGWVAVLSDGTFGAFRKGKPDRPGWVPMYALRSDRNKASNNDTRVPRYPLPGSVHPGRHSQDGEQ